jgi:carbon-monoxide dehydrogenase small subunit
VNGEPRQVEIDGRLLLVEAIRDALGLTGTHIGCLNGDCGACTVRIDGRVAKSCLLLAASQQDADITTIEGLSEGDDLHPLQQAFWDEHGFQCGYCLPGMLFSALDLLDRVAEPTEGEIRAALDGGICRCTGYETIVRSVQAAIPRLRASSQG